MATGTLDALGRLAQYVLVARLVAAALTVGVVLEKLQPSLSLMLALGLMIAANYAALRRWPAVIEQVQVQRKPAYLALDAALATSVLGLVGVGAPLVLYLVGTGLLAGLVYRGRIAVAAAFALTAGYAALLVTEVGYLPGREDLHTVVTLPALMAGSGAVGVAVKRLLLAQDRSGRELAVLREQAAVREERLRVARDLHDTVTKNLHGIWLLAQGLLGALDRGDHGSARRTAEVIGSTASGLAGDARDAIHDLRDGGEGDDDGVPPLADALEELVSRIGAEHRLVIDLRVFDPPPVDGPARHEVLAVAGEALHNVVKHARADRVEVRLEGGADGLRLVVADDGVGLADPDAAPAGHYGITGMRERAERVGGRLRVTGGPGRGTTVALELPPEQPDAAAADPTGAVQRAVQSGARRG